MQDDVSAETITPGQLLAAYAAGYFPMADSRGAENLYWYHPVRRGVLPLDAFHVPRSLKKFLRSHPYTVQTDTAFRKVMEHCADIRTEKRRDSWINDTIIELYCTLHAQGHAHSVECWQDGALVGGLYGVSLGGAFFGESMFSLAANASKVALVSLVGRLLNAGYTLLDTQYVNDHLLQFGIEEIPRADYLLLLEKSLKASPNPSTLFRTVSDIRA
jgi:leucyl/phenylalanyl-tRNA--protein transferase